MDRSYTREELVDAIAAWVTADGSVSEQQGIDSLSGREAYETIDDFIDTVGPFDMPRENILRLVPNVIAQLKSDQRELERMRTESKHPMRSLLESISEVEDKFKHYTFDVDDDHGHNYV